MRALFSRTVIQKILGLFRLSLRGTYLSAGQMADFRLVFDWDSYSRSLNGGTFNAHSSLYPGAVTLKKHEEAATLENVARYSSLFGGLLSGLLIFTAAAFMIEDFTLALLFGINSLFLLPFTFSTNALKAKRSFTTLARVEVYHNVITFGVLVPAIVFYQLKGLVAAHIFGRLLVVFLCRDQWSFGGLPTWAELRKSVQFGSKIAVTNLFQSVYMSSTYQSMSMFLLATNKGFLGQFAFALGMANLVKTGLESIKIVQGAENLSQIRQYAESEPKKLSKTMESFGATDMLIASTGCFVLTGILLPTIPLLFPKFGESIVLIPGLLFWTLVQCSYNYHPIHIKIRAKAWSQWVLFSMGIGFNFLAVYGLYRLGAAPIWFAVVPGVVGFLVSAQMIWYSLKLLGHPKSWLAEYGRKFGFLLINGSLLAVPFLPGWQIPLALVGGWLLGAFYMHRVYPESLAKFIAITCFWKKSR